MSEHTDDFPAQQCNYDIGYGKPPKEHQFQPGQSGNPAGSPKPRTNLYRHISKYSAMTDTELAQLDQASMTQSEKAALKIVQDMASGKRPGAEGMARYVVDREEGKPVAHHIVDTLDQDIRKALGWFASRSQEGTD